MEIWIILFAVKVILSSLCPFTSKIGSIIGMVAMIATLVFIPLTFFFAPHWWYGLITLGLYFLLPLLLPRVNPMAMGTTARSLSGIGSIVSDVVVVLMYLYLFKVL